MYLMIHVVDSHSIVHCYCKWRQGDSIDINDTRWCKYGEWRRKMNMSIQEHFDNEFKINGSFVYVTGAWIDSKDNSGKPLCL